MGHEREPADIPAGQDSPLAYAITSRDRSVIAMVQQAVEHEQVMLAFQAIVPAGRQSRPAFYEGLIRVLDETGRIIPANEFIHVIETTETGRIIDCLALEQGLRTLAEYPDLRLALNMSARSAGYRRWNDTLAGWLQRDPTIGERLILEITESSAMLIPEVVTGFMNELQQEGISFALDHFGAGFTSFRYLRDFYFDILKIDGQFIRGIAENPDNQILTAALASIAEQFDMLTVAENVERPEDAAYLTSAGIDCLQGYFFGAPSVRLPWVDAGLGKATA
ncbi:EAL domain, c-di-GMP-specific phosphodiesterase class I (or its enzymatically inactive variant) [Roseovarius pacificus]|uniref:EAL domain, c-di-GMP-specific phosphodiesterase class I (Or its enzymatically inactive variant) n=1 Tax=Roseovarius pacificus TaxID=337701 RepID=A0A1M7B3N0_9RHOB|nr:EAL domain-containing protein [Roseovarius pacificus]GGO54643.1 diguanylate phosphodiesterase [Roseovarius pacificus]SHL49615.1 EAL domain, c-di-GMP-specific phosphodiesterase class I (or its enzymatically inactive variant) [Roseovarius pacificus]